MDSNVSNTTAIAVRQPLVSDDTRILLFILYMAIGAFGFVANGVVIVTIHFGRLRSSVSKLIMNLALADLFSCTLFTIYMPTTMLIFRYEWVFGALACKLFSFCTACAMLASPFTITAIALTQYYIVRRIERVHSSEKCNTALLVLVIWTCAATGCIPLLLFQQTMTVRNVANTSDVTVCGWNILHVEAGRVFSLVLFIVEFALPGVVVPVTSVVVITSLRRTLSKSESLISATSELHRSQREKQKQLIFIFACMTAMFITLRFPVQLINILKFNGIVVTTDVKVDVLMRLCSPLFIVFSYACDPIFYASLSSEFKTAHVYLTTAQPCFTRYPCAKFNPKAIKGCLH